MGIGNVVRRTLVCAQGGSVSHGSVGLTVRSFSDRGPDLDFDSLIGFTLVRREQKRRRRSYGEGAVVVE